MTLQAQRLFAETVLTAAGWQRDVAITVDADGRIASLEPGQTANGTRLGGPVVPPLTDLHSHAFQRALAGLTNRAGPGDDSFWTWREAMYRLVARLTPADVTAIAARLQVELMKGGFGRLVEFHYLHHDRDGRRYADPAEMALALLAASEQSGLPLTLLPVFYAHGDFGGAAPTAGQQRFIHDRDSYLGLLDRLAGPCRQAGAKLGVALHSLRAVTADEMTAVLAASPPGAPIHIHVAEQQREVEACLAHTGRRPVEWLYDLAAVDDRWCLVHATHVLPHEVELMIRSGAVVGLCPTTEADLGDGLFPAEAFLKAGGQFGIGTDSHVATTVADELRLLEYGQRLAARRRNCLAAGPGGSVGRRLFEAALAGGARAAGVAPAGIAVGAPADLVVLDGASPYVATATDDDILDRWLFGGLGPVVADVMIGGRWRIRDGRHAAEAAIDRAFMAALRRLAG